jgi:uncharacterized protein involved in exopolysaccharide biosynthesis
MSTRHPDENASAETLPHGKGVRSSWLIWLPVAVIAGLVVLAVVVVFSPAKVYQASATLKVRSVTSGSASPAAPTVVTPEVMQKTTDSASLVPKIVAKLAVPLRTALMQPYASDPAHAPPVASILSDGLKIEQMRGTMLLQVSYRHPDPTVAAQIANLCAEEMLIWKMSRAWDVVSVDWAVPPTQPLPRFSLQRLKNMLEK